LHAKEHLVESPLLPCLPLDFGILKRALDKTASAASSNTSEEGAPLQAHHHWDGLTKRLVGSPPREASLKDTELHATVDD